MRESSTEPLAGLDDYRNVTDLLVRRAQAAPDHAAFDVPATRKDPHAEWRRVTTREFLAQVRALAKGLIAVGVHAGDAVAILAPTRYEWAVADLATWFAGAVVVPVYDTSSPSQVAAIVADAEVRLAIAGSDAHVAVLRGAFDATGAGSLGIWSMDEPAPRSADPTSRDAAANGSIAELVARAHEIGDEILEERRTLAATETPATIVYTSGTTGEPKGAVLTHGNFLGQVLNIAAAYREIVHPDGNTVIFLPLAHVLARGLQLICLASGMRIAHLSDPSGVVAVLDVLRPTFLVVVPRVLQKVQAAAGATAADKGLDRVWRSACATAVEWGSWAERRDTGEQIRIPLRVRLRHLAYNRVFYRRLRRVLGGRLGYMLSGGATLDAELSLFFRGIGIPVIEGYGLTETTAPLTGNLPGRIRSGTVGLPLPGSTVRISEEGEVLARGVGVFSGYRDPRHNEDAFTDGFFRTGDLGHLDANGRLVLEGRLKDVITTSNGKTVVPALWENAVESSPIVAHAVMVGEGKPYLSALVLLDPQATAEWAAQHGIENVDTSDTDPDKVAHPWLRAHMQDVIDRANSLVARSEQVRRFTLVFADLEDRTIVTPTMKIRRRVMLDRAAETVADLYTEKAPLRSSRKSTT